MNTHAHMTWLSIVLPCRTEAKKGEQKSQSFLHRWKENIICCLQRFRDPERGGMILVEGCRHARVAGLTRLLCVSDMSLGSREDAVLEEITS